MSTRSSKQRGGTPFRHDVTRLEIERIQQEIEQLKGQIGEEQPTDNMDHGLKVLNLELPGDIGKQELSTLYDDGTAISQYHQSLSSHPPNTAHLYNPLDKGTTAPHLPKTNTLPFSREKTVSVHDLKEPHVQTMGVVPIRSTGSIHGLNVMMQGKPALFRDDQEIAAVQEANEDLVTLSPTFTVATSVVDAELRRVAENPTPRNLPHHGYPAKKPAILGSEGTIAPVRFSNRSLGSQQIDAVIRTQRRKMKAIKSPKKSAGLMQTTCSLRSEEVFDSDTVDPSVISGSMPPSRPSSKTKLDRKSSSAGSNKSVQELLSEAVDLTRADSLPLHKRKQSKGESMKKQKETECVSAANPQERSVDDIIASLKATKHGNVKSEADIRIQEIMSRVMKSAASVLGSDVESQEDLKVEETKNGEALAAQDKSSDQLDIDEVTESAAPGQTTQGEALEKNKEEPVAEPITESPPKPQDPIIETEVTGGPLDDPLPSHSKTVLQAVKMVSSLPLEELEKAWKDLTMPHQVSYGDVVRVEGTAAPLLGKQTLGETTDNNKKGMAGVTVQSASVSFLSTWAPDKPEREKPVSEVPDFKKSIHHFCTMNPVDVTGQLQMTTRMYHTPSKHKATSHLRSTLNNNVEMSTPVGSSDGLNAVPTGESESENDREKDKKLQDWQERAQELLETGVLPGQKLPVYQDASRLYWTPAPPKMNLPGKYIGETLFPRFHGAVIKTEGDTLSAVTEHDSDEEAEADLALYEEETEGEQFRTRVLTRQYRSAEDLTKEIRSSFADLTKSSDSGRNTGQVEPMSPQNGELRRSQSAPNLLGEEYILYVESDFDSCMRELLHQQEQIERMKHDIPEPVNNDTPELEISTRVETSQEHVPLDSPDNIPTKRDKSPTLAEKSREAGLKYVLYPQKKKKKKRKPLDPRRLENIEAFLKTPARVIERRHSFREKRLPVEEEFTLPIGVQHQRRPSLPLDLDFDEFLKKQPHSEEISDARDWVRQIWDDWFDELFAQSPAASETEEDDHQSIVPSPGLSDEMRDAVMSSASSVNIDVLNPLLETEDDAMLYEDIQEEVERLTKVINEAVTPLAFVVARRGALYRKMGKISQAWDDLNAAIEMEPQLLDAYWHRHLLYLLKGKPMKALEDLGIILKINKKHVGAYKSRAEIFRQQGDVTMAIMNYTQSIKLMPDDYEAYYKRAEMYEKRNEMLLALDDYREASRLMPSKTEAIFKRGFYQFNNKNWMSAIKDFTEMLAQEPKNATARTYRGRAFAKQGMYVEAIADLSAGIHLDPVNSIAFYHRGCLLRKANPKQALQDLSISILLDDSRDNLMAFFHRGILYVELDRYHDAISDFENVLLLDKTMAAAHVNIGLIYLNKLDNYYRAIQKFTSAIKVDPTYDRALVCRGEAYNKIHKCHNALKDFTSTIHLRPDKQHYYMFRGQVLLKMKNLELASFCVKHAAELSHGLGSSPTQQAAVQSFLQNYPAAIDVLRESVKVQPNAPSYILLGKTQIKAKKFKEAVNSLEKALEIMKPWTENQSWPPEAAEVYYLTGMCHMEIPNYLRAFEAFNSAIRINSEYPEAYYQRGLTRIKMRQTKGILDFNRALSLNPKLFQAYLSRAAYYGMKKRYSKGIFNCNEAIQLQPNSVRAYLYRGALKYYIQAYRLAIVDLSKAIDIDTSCSLAYFNRAVCYHTTGDYSRAQRDYGIVLMLGEDESLKVLINRGLLYLSQKDYKNAREDFVQAVKVNPRDPKIRQTLAICCHKLNRLEEAVKVYTDTLQVDPFFLEAYLGRASALMDYGHSTTVTLARRDCERALYLDPQCLKARVGLGYNLQVCGKFRLAWNNFTAALAIDPNYQPALEGRAIVCLQMSDSSAALKDLNAALKIGPTAELYTNRGVVHQFMGHSTDAMTDYQSAIKIDPMYALAYYNAANLYFNNRQFLQANEHYSKTIELNPNDEGAMLNRAITRVLLRDVKGALTDFQQAASMSPYSAHIFFNRANLYASLRRYQLAEQDYTTALRLLPDDPMVYKRRADVRSKLGWRDKAIDDYRQAVNIQTKVLVH